MSFRDTLNHIKLKDGRLLNLSKKFNIDSYDSDRLWFGCYDLEEKVFKRVSLKYWYREDIEERYIRSDIKCQ